MLTHDIIVVGASAGGVEALTVLAGGLPPHLPAAVFVVLHIPAGAPSQLPHILSRAGPLRATHAEDGQPIRNGHIYVAPADFHLLLEHGYIRVARGPRENHSRPAADPLFRSAAVAYGPRVVGVVLSGALNDGTAGLLAIKRRGGITVVQDPAEAFFPGMPASALEYAPVDYRLSLAEMPSLLTRLAREPAHEEGAPAVPDEMALETRIAQGDASALTSTERFGQVSAFTCPECRGPLWEVQDGQLLRYRCRVGHAFTSEVLQAGHTTTVEDALWAALNTLHENARLTQRLAEDARRHQRLYMAARFEQKARQARERAEVIRKVLASANTQDDAPTSGEEQHAERTWSERAAQEQASARE